MIMNFRIPSSIFINIIRAQEEIRIIPCEPITLNKFYENNSHKNSKLNKIYKKRKGKLLALIIDEKQIKKLDASKKKQRRGRAVKASKKEERLLQKKMGALWEYVLRPTANRITQMVRDGVDAVVIADVIEGALRAAELQYGIATDDLITQWQMGVGDESRKALQKGLSGSLAVDISALVDVPEIADTLSLGSIEASQLIKSIPSEYLGQIAKAVTDNYVGVAQPGDRSLLQQIKEIGKVSKNRARLIARDQTSKLTAAVNQTRQTSIGISMYIWHNSQDNRVVGKPGGLYPKGNKAHGNHWVMEGVYCKWNDHSVYSVDKGKSWKKRTGEMPKIIPGAEIQCRCHAEPIIDIEKILEFAKSS